MRSIQEDEPSVDCRFSFNWGKAMETFLIDRRDLFMTIHFYYIISFSCFQVELSLAWEIKVLEHNNQTTTPNFTFTEKSYSNKDDATIGTAVGVTIAAIAAIGIIVIIIRRWKQVSPLTFIRNCNKSTSTEEESEPMKDMKTNQDDPLEGWTILISLRLYLLKGLDITFKLKVKIV